MASKVSVKGLIALFQKMYIEHWSYVWGSATKGCVDCSGAFDYAFKELEGIDYPHGSNSIARKFIVGELLPISEAKPGMAAFKAHMPGEKGYDLPDKFLPGNGSFNGDLNDYYHIGLVDNDTNWVLNAKGTNYGFCRDELIKKNGWDFVAYLKGVDYDNSAEEKGETTMQEAYVVLPSGAKGHTVNLRKTASTNAMVVKKVPVGSKVTVEKDLGQWCKVTYETSSGYMMSNYIEYEGQADETGSFTDDEREAIDRALKEIEKQTEIIGSIVGRG